MPSKLFNSRKKQNCIQIMNLWTFNRRVGSLPLHHRPSSKPTYKERNLTISQGLAIMQRALNHSSSDKHSTLAWMSIILSQKITLNRIHLKLEADLEIIAKTKVGFHCNKKMKITYINDSNHLLRNKILKQKQILMTLSSWSHSNLFYISQFRNHL